MFPQIFGGDGRDWRKYLLSRVHLSQSLFLLPGKSKRELPTFLYLTKIIAAKPITQGRFSHIPIYNALEACGIMSARDAQLSHDCGGPLIQNRVHWNRVNHPRRGLLRSRNTIKCLFSLMVSARGTRAWFLCTRMDLALSIMVTWWFCSLARCCVSRLYNQITRDK